MLTGEEVTAKASEVQIFLSQACIMQLIAFPLVLLTFGESFSCFHEQQRWREVERSSAVIQMASYATLYSKFHSTLDVFQLLL